MQILIPQTIILFTLLLLSSCELVSQKLDGGACEYVNFEDEFKVILTKDDMYYCTSLNGLDTELLLTRTEMYSKMEDSLIGIDSTTLVINGSRIIHGTCAPEIIHGIRKNK